MIFEIIPNKDEVVEQLVRRFIKKTKRCGIIRELKERQYHVKPSEKRNRQKQYYKRLKKLNKKN